MHVTSCIFHLQSCGCGWSLAFQDVILHQLRPSVALHISFTIKAAQTAAPTQNDLRGWFQDPEAARLAQCLGALPVPAVACNCGSLV
jgi:hypothetical protein